MELAKFTCGDAGELEASISISISIEIDIAVSRKIWPTHNARALIARSLAHHVGDSVRRPLSEGDNHGFSRAPSDDKIHFRRLQALFIDFAAQRSAPLCDTRRRRCDASVSVVRGTHLRIYYIEYGDRTPLQGEAG